MYQDSTQGWIAIGNSDGKLVRVENKKMPIDETNFPDDVLDSEFAAYDEAAIVNSTSWSV